MLYCVWKYSIKREWKHAWTADGEQANKSLHCKNNTSIEIENSWRDDTFYNIHNPLPFHCYINAVVVKIIFYL